MSKLVERGITAFLWGSGGAVLRMLLQIGSQVVLARVLGPAEYGVFATCQIVIALSSFLADVGLAYGLIQKPQVSDTDIRFVLGWQLVLGAGTAGAIVLASGHLAAFFGEPRAAPVMQVLAGVCLVNAVAAPAACLLKRNLDFRRFQIASVVSYFIGFFVFAIPLALAGAGVWALAAGWAVQAVVLLLIVYGAVRHPLRPVFWHDGAGGQWRYAASVFGTNVVNWLSVNVDRVVVARVFGAADVGLYNTSFNTVYAPGAAVAGVVQPVLFSAASRSSGDVEKLGAAYRQATVMVLLLVGGPFAVVASLAGPVVRVLLGPQWAGAERIVAPLALAMPFFAWSAVSTPMLWTRDRVTREMSVQVPLMLLTAGVAAYAASYSVVAVAWAVLGMYVMRATALGTYALRACAVSGTQFARLVAPGFLWLGCTAMASAAVGAMTAPLPAWARLLAGAGAAAMVFLTLPRLFPGICNEDSRAALSHLLVRVPVLSGVLGFARRGTDKR